MTFRTLVSKINIDKLIYILIAIIIIIYLLVGMFNTFDFKKYNNIFKDVANNYYIDLVKTYVINHKDYYYPINNATYCITKEELQNSGEFKDNELDNIKNTLIEVDYINGNYTVSYNDNCVEK